MKQDQSKQKIEEQTEP